MREFSYNRQKAIEYADNWAFSRNPRYFDFENFGGDCTNFISQCLFAGTGIMNYTRTFGWYYNSSYDRSPSWTGVEFFYNFLMRNKSVGPFGFETEISNIEPGDIIQLGGTSNFYHSLLVMQINGEPNINNILVTTHTYDANFRPLNTYIFERARFLHISGYRNY